MARPYQPRLALDVLAIEGSLVKLRDLLRSHMIPFTIKANVKRRPMINNISSTPTSFRLLLIVILAARKLVATRIRVMNVARTFACFSAKAIAELKIVHDLM